MGKSARCTCCQNHFIIPESDDAKPKRIMQEPLESDGDIISGFYRAVLKKSWPLIFCKSSATGLVFVAALIVLKFVIFNFNYTFSVYIKATGENIEIPIRIGNTIGTCAYALIFWYYMEIIYASAFGNDKFPTIKLGHIVDIVCKIAKTLYLFVAAMTMAQLPTLTAMLIMNILQIKSTPTLIAIAICCCFTFPMLVLMAAISQDLLSVLRIDLAIRAILQIFPQYCLAAAITAAVIIAATLSRNYHFNMTETPALIPLYLMANILMALAGTYAARTLGLLYKHHGGQMPW